MNLKTTDEIQKMRIAGKILASVAKEIISEAGIGVNLKSLDILAKKLILKAGGKPAFLGYQPYGAKKPYPASICTSINDVIVHGIPTNYKLNSGDILKLDFGVSYKNYYADAAWTIGIGNISATARKLIQVTKTALDRAIHECMVDKTLGDIGFVINDFARKNGFKVVEGLTGHGIGKELHEEPSVFNFGQKGRGLRLQAGMVLAIEPMISAGTDKIVQRFDDSFATADGSLSAHFEHTILITENEPEVLTQF